MKLFVLRHADAEIAAPSDDQRALTAKGVEQSKRMAELCKSQNQVPEVILHSPLLRARETAELFGKGVDLPRLIEAPWLACGMTPVTALEELGSYDEFSSVLLVGHEPDLSGLIASCLGLPNPLALHIRKASLALVEMDSLKPGAGRLEYLVSAKFVKP